MDEFELPSVKNNFVKHASSVKSAPIYSISLSHCLSSGNRRSTQSKKDQSQEILAPYEQRNWILNHYKMKREEAQMMIIDEKRRYNQIQEEIKAVRKELESKEHQIDKFWKQGIQIVMQLEKETNKHQIDRLKRKAQRNEFQKNYLDADLTKIYLKLKQLDEQKESAEKQIEELEKEFEENQKNIKKEVFPNIYRR